MSLSGDLSGDYVVVEERPDGSLVVAPDAARQSRRVDPRPPAPRFASMLAGLRLPSPSEPASVPALLEEWGVELAEDEGIEEFLMAEINGEPGFVAVTTQRFICATHTQRKAAVVQEYLLAAARNVELVGRRRKQKLRVSWHGSDSLIWVPDKDAFARLHRLLAGHAAL